MRQPRRGADECSVQVLRNYPAYTTPRGLIVCKYSVLCSTEHRTVSTGGIGPGPWAPGPWGHLFLSITVSDSSDGHRTPIRWALLWALASGSGPLASSRGGWLREHLLWAGMLPSVLASFAPRHVPSRTLLTCLSSLASNKPARSPANPGTLQQLHSSSGWLVRRTGSAKGGKKWTLICKTACRRPRRSAILPHRQLFDGRGVPPRDDGFSNKMHSIEEATLRW